MEITGALFIYIYILGPYWQGPRADPIRRCGTLGSRTFLFCEHRMRGISVSFVHGFRSRVQELFHEALVYG